MRRALLALLALLFVVTINGVVVVTAVTYRECQAPWVCGIAVWPPRFFLTYQQ